jgi:uncharacterized phage protein gp47/JayE
MPIPVRQLKDIRNQLDSNVFSSTGGEIDPRLDPFYNSTNESLAKVVNALENSINDSTFQLFAQTATTEDSLALISFHGTRNEIKRKDAKFSSGLVLAIAESQVDVPVGTEFITQDGNVYASTVFNSCITQTLNVSALERVGNYAIATITAHNLGNLMELTIAGSSPSSFNGTYEIEIIDANTIKYANVGDDEEASGSIAASFLGCRVSVQSVSTGASSNKTYNDTIDIASNIALTNSYVCFSGIFGGADIESLQSWKNRLIDYFAFPQNYGNLYQLNTWVSQNSTANYVYFYNKEDSLYLYLTGVVSKMSDFYDFTNFTSAELNAIKTKMITENKFSLSGVSPLNFSIVNPVFVPINVSISGLSPNTLQMKTAIEKALKKYLALLPINKFIQAGQVSDNKIFSVISSVVDVSGKSPDITSVSISGATGLDAEGKKPILGTVTYG